MGIAKTISKFLSKKKGQKGGAEGPGGTRVKPDAVEAGLLAAAEATVVQRPKPAVMDSPEDAAAVKIQTAFRGHEARRQLRALRALVKVQALARGHLVRRQAAATLRCMHALVRVQARVRARAVRRTQEGRAVQELMDKGLGSSDAALNRKGEGQWLSNKAPLEKMEDEFQRRQDGFIKRQRSRAYAAYTKANELQRRHSSFVPSPREEENASWMWLERWMAAQSWNHRPAFISRKDRRKGLGGFRKHESPAVHCDSCGRLSTRVHESDGGRHHCGVCSSTSSWAAKTVTSHHQPLSPPAPLAAEGPSMPPSNATSVIMEVTPKSSGKGGPKAPHPQLSAKPSASPRDSSTTSLATRPPVSQDSFATTANGKREGPTDPVLLRRDSGSSSSLSRRDPFQRMAAGGFMAATASSSNKSRPKRPKSTPRTRPQPMQENPHRNGKRMSFPLEASLTRHPSSSPLTDLRIPPHNIMADGGSPDLVKKGPTLPLLKDDLGRDEVKINSKADSGSLDEGGTPIGVRRLSLELNGTALH